MNGDDPVLAERLEQLALEIRRQGRAAVAAQAAAESCLAELRLLQPGAAGEDADDSAIELIEALLPVFDSLDRAVAQARGAAARAAAPGMLARLVPRPAARELGALAEGLGLLGEQLVAVLDEQGVGVERPTGRPDATRHRVVEVRAVPGAQAGTIVEVVRPGYSAGSRIVREAAVVIAGPRDSGVVIAGPRDSG